MSGIYGLEKFSHLEDKIYRTIEQFKRERTEREALEREVLSLRRELSQLSDEKERMSLQVERLLNHPSNLAATKSTAQPSISCGIPSSTRTPTISF